MGLLDNIFGSGSTSGSSGSSIAKPIIMGLLALLASRYLSGGSKPASASPDMASAPDGSPGDILGGLGGLLEQFQQKGLGEVADSWVNVGPNKSLTPDQISKAIDPDIIDALSQRIGLSKEQISQILSQFLPNAVDQLTPEGRLPTQQEMSRLIG
jgi:uncharacterized protein YidB (DUF937 family)